MDSTDPQGSGTHRAPAYQEELAERIARAVSEDGRVEPLKGLYFHRSSTMTDALHGCSDPAFCVIAQGSKQVWLGDSVYRYDPAHYLLATVELPIVSRIVEASPERPYLSLRLDLDPALVSSVIVEAGHLPAPNRGDMRAIDVSPLDADLLDATVRLVRLLDSPAEARVLRPLITREIVFRLLMGDQGNRLRHLALLGGGHTDRIAEAVERLRKELNQPLRIESLARELGMSVSGFHHHFKAVTAMSPLQFQKQIRLQEARRLMFGENLDAASAGYRVGYEDASQFSREYKRLFGQPPMRDVERLREAARSPGPAVAGAGPV
ncbi:MAG TPA: AraC family transcriptional regulator [Thermoanaerobaculia bacterium]